MTCPEFKYYRRLNRVTQARLIRHAGFVDTKMVWKAEKGNYIPEIFILALGRILDIKLNTLAKEKEIKRLYAEHLSEIAAQPLKKIEQKLGVFQK